MSGCGLGCGGRGHGCNVDGMEDASLFKAMVNAIQTPNSNIFPFLKEATCS